MSSSSSSSAGPSIERLQAQLRAAQGMLTICQSEKARLTRNLEEVTQQKAQLENLVSILQMHPQTEDDKWLGKGMLDVAQALKLPMAANTDSQQITLRHLLPHAAAIMATYEAAHLFLPVWTNVNGEWKITG